MLDIVPSYNPVQYQEKLTMQTWEHFEYKFGPKKFFREFYLYSQLDIVLNYPPMQFKRKPTNQTWKNDEKN